MSESTEVRPGSIVWTDLTVADAEGIRDFYQAVVGWESRGEEMGGFEDYHMIPPGFDASVTGICHARGTNSNVPPQWLVYFAVEDVDASAAKAVVAGGTIIDGPRHMGSGRFCVIQDPAGAVCALFRSAPSGESVEAQASVGSTVLGIAPQFLVDDLDRSIGYYRDRLGFKVDFVYEGFYASVRDRSSEIHLKHAPKIEEDRAHRRENEHLDASIQVNGIDALYLELQERGATVIKPLERRPWNVRDFYVEDPDGYILCFGEQA